MFASCTSDFDGSSGTPGPNDPIPLLVNNITLEESTVATRAATAPAVGSSIGVFRQADSYYTTASNNVKYTLTADKGWQVATTGTDILLGSNDSRALLYAYHPANDKIAVKADNVTIDLAAREYDADYDLSYVPAGWAQALDVSGLVYNFHPGVNFTMRHAYTQLGVDLTRGSDYGGVGAITAVSLTVNGGGKLYSTATQNIATGDSVPGTADISKVTYTVPADTKMTTAAKTASFRYLLPPGKSGTISDLTLTATVDGVTTRTTISATGLDLKAGTRYVVKATLNYTGLAASIKTADWDSQPSWNENVTFVPIIPPIDLGLPFVIASGNLIATADGSGGYTYAFAEWQGYYSGDVTKGDYFAWNTLEPNKDTNRGSWNDAHDPCRQIAGGEWRTPTVAQWNEMATKGTVWGTYTTRGGTTVDGRYIGTSSVPSPTTQDRYVFLPAAGYTQSANGSLYSIGTVGMYLNYQPSVDNGENGYLYFDTGSFAPEGGLYGNEIVPVRCVKQKPKDPIDIGLDFLIAPGNVVATSDGKGGYTYAFAEEQGYYSGVLGATYDGTISGDYFRWNTLDPSALESSNPTASFGGGTYVWDDAADVCRKIGDGQWHTPTGDQLLKLNGLYDNGKAVKGTYTLNNNTTVSGYYFGTTEVPSSLADQDKYVFLPLAGYARNSGNIWEVVDERGYYRGCSIGQYSYPTTLQFDEGYCSVDEIDYMPSHEGYSVRCVRDK